MGFIAAAQAVVELGHDASADRLAELTEGARTLRDRDAEDGLARFAELGAFRDEAEPIEVHVRAAQDGRQRRALRAGPLDPLPQAGDPQRAGRLHDRSRVVEDLLDRGADLVVRHAHDLVHRLPDDRKRDLSHLAHGDTIGKDADAIEHDRAACRHRLEHGVGLVGLHANHANAGAERLDVAGDPGDQPASSDGDEDGRHIAEAVTKDLVADRALAGDHQWIVERMDEREPRRLDDAVTVGLGIRVAVAREDHFGAHLAHGLHLDLGRGLRHHDDGAKTEVARRVRDALSMIPRAGRNDSPPALVVGHVRDAVVGAAELEAEDGLKIFAFEEHPVLEPRRQSGGGLEGRFLGHVVDAARQDQAQHGVGRH